MLGALAVSLWDIFAADSEVGGGPLDTLSFAECPYADVSPKSGIALFFILWIGPETPFFAVDRLPCSPSFPVFFLPYPLPTSLSSARPCKTIWGGADVRFRVPLEAAERFSGGF